MKRPSALLDLGFALTAIAVIPLAGCGSESSDGGEGDAEISLRIITDGSAPVNAAIRKFNPFNALLRSDSLLGFGPAAVAGTTTSSLQSLKYYIQNVQICKDVTRNGSGFSATDGCVTIYENSAADSYSTYNIDSAMADTDPDHWIDFMDADSRAKLSAKPTVLTSEVVGAYNYGLINFMTPIKVTAEFKDAAGVTRFVTKTPTAAEIITDASNSSITDPQHVEYAGDRYRSGTAEELTVQNNNGGTILAFMKPFEITQDDIDSGTGFYVDFVFNPNDFATASSSGVSCGGGVNTIGPADCTSFVVPMGKLAPVPHKPSEAVEKEVYLVSGFSSGNDMRIELYYNASDDSKAIMGVDRSAVVTASSSADGSNALPYGYRVEEENGSVTFYGYNSATNDITAVELSGLVRRTDGTVTLYPSLGGSSTKSYTFVGTQSVSGD